MVGFVIKNELLHALNFHYFAGAALHHFIELQVRFLVIISVYISYYF